MENLSEMYETSETPANELKGFTKSFQKRSKDKREEDVNVVELLSFARDQKLVFGTKVTEKLCKQGAVSKIYLAANSNEFVTKKIEHYCSILGIECVKLDLDNNELSQKLAKPFLVSTISVRA